MPNLSTKLIDYLKYQNNLKPNQCQINASKVIEDVIKKSIVDDNGRRKMLFLSWWPAKLGYNLFFEQNYLEKRIEVNGIEIEDVCITGYNVPQRTTSIIATNIILLNTNLEYVECAELLLERIRSMTSNDVKYEMFIILGEF